MTVSERTGQGYPERASAKGVVDFLRSIIDAVPDAVVTIDRTGHIESFSPAAERMFGYTSDEVIGENVAVLTASPHREQHDEYLARYHATGEPHIIGIGRVTTARRRDGSTFPIELSVSETDYAGRRIYAGFIRDLSEVKDGHRRLQDLHVEGAHVGRLAQLSGLASAIAHELNQPLSAATNYAEVAKYCLDPETQDTAQARDALRHCAEETERAGRIVQQLRQFFARGETTKTRVKLGQLIGEAVAIAMADGKSRERSIWFESEPDQTEILADRVQIQQVLMNLVRDALEAMEQGHGRMVRIYTERLGDQWVQVTVEDSGSGIPPEIAEHLFHPLRTTKPDGMGLGLSICQQIILGHGGRIWSGPSTLGGAAFHFTLRLISAEEGTIQ